jgi:hypothetical protein
MSPIHEYFATSSDDPAGALAAWRGPTPVDCLLWRRIGRSPGTANRLAHPPQAGGPGPA